MARQKSPKAEWVVTKDGETVYTVAHARATVRGDHTVDDDLSKIEGVLHSTGRFVIVETILPVDMWEDDPNGGVLAIIPVASATDTTIPIVYTNPNEYGEVTNCGFRNLCKAEKGVVRVYAKMKPKSELQLQIICLFAQGEENPEYTTPIGGYYKLPIATADRLGCVKIGANLHITEEGVLSGDVGTKDIADATVGEDVAEEIYKELFNINDN